MHHARFHKKEVPWDTLLSIVADWVISLGDRACATEELSGREWTSGTLDAKCDWTPASYSRVRRITKVYHANV